MAAILDFFEVAPRLNLKVMSQGIIMPKMALVSTMVTIVTLSHQTISWSENQYNQTHLMQLQLFSISDVFNESKSTTLTSFFFARAWQEFWYNLVSWRRLTLLLQRSLTDIGCLEHDQHGNCTHCSMV